MSWFRKTAEIGPEALERAVYQAAGRSQAIIRFHPDGTIIDANDLFLRTLGYDLADIKGQHHRIFVDPTAAARPDYATFWEMLRNGDVSSGEFERVTKSGQHIWISASYTPIYDTQNKVIQIVKFATDITARHRATASLIDALGILAKGDLAVRLAVRDSDVDKDIRTSFNATVTRLGELIQGIVLGTESLDGVTQSVGSLSKQLLQETSQQADLITEIKQAVGQIATQVQSTNVSVEKLDAQASVSASKSKEGASIVAQAIKAIHGIQDLTKQVSQNTLVIENFAFQTNLLSLNAAVEAARAGSAGLGFAVVATEVRALSNKSREASLVISELTRRCEQEVIEGTKLIEAAGRALVEIENTANGVAAATATIAEASRNQSLGITTVERSLEQIDISVRDAKGLSTEGNTQAERLDSEAALLRRLIRSFSIAAGRGGAATEAQAMARIEPRVARSARAGGFRQAG